MICHNISVSSREMNPRSSVVAGVERGSKLANNQLWGGLASVCAKTHTQTLRRTFVSSFPSRLCAKLAPMAKWRRRG